MASKKDRTAEPTKPSPSARMLKKALSFKTRLIRRTPSANWGTTSPLVATTEGSPKHRRRTLSRGNSFNEGTENDKRKKDDSSSGSYGGQSGGRVPPSPDIDRLETESRKVFQALGYVQQVVDKSCGQAAVDEKILHVLPGAITIVLESTMEVNQLLDNYFSDHESTAKLTSQNQVYRNLANLVRWGDSLLLQGVGLLNKESADVNIKALIESIEELLKFAVDKLRKRAYQKLQALPPKSPTTRPLSTASEGSHRNSLPDIPLTPREQRILEETNCLANLEDIKSTTVLTTIEADGEECDGDEPPPKPPLPENWASPLMDRTVPHRKPVDPGGPDLPPPLPAKQRSSTSQDNSNLSESPGSGSSAFLSPTSAHSPGFHSLLSTSPVSQSSPGSSVRSSISGSSDDLVLDRTQGLRPNTTMQSPGSPRYSTYDNFMALTKHNHDRNIQTIADKIGALVGDLPLNNLPTSPTRSSGAEESPLSPNGHMPSGGEIDRAPPLPNKKVMRRTVTRTERIRVRSQYDNIQGTKVDSSRTISAGGAIATTSSSFTDSDPLSPPCLLRTSQSAGGISRLSPFNQPELSRQGTFSSSETFSSAGTFSSSAESLQKPPPLPLKKKHVEAYMSMLGSYDSPREQELSRHSIHSMNFYQAQWLEHQRELFSPLYPRSNTISIMSSISSHSSRSSGMIDERLLSPGYIAGSSSSSGLSLPPLLPPKEHKMDGLPPASLPERIVREVPIKISNIEIKPPELVEEQSEEDAVSTSTNTSGYTSISTSNSTCTDSTGENDPRLSARLSSGSSSTRPSPPPEHKDSDSDFAELSTLDDVDVSDQLIRRKPVSADNEERPEIRGGSIDALIVHATTAGKQELMYQEAFLTTYRTFISPQELIIKLLHRYEKFARMHDVRKKKLSRNAFSLLIRVVDELCMEVDLDILTSLMELTVQLLCDGELMLGRILRKKVLEKHELLKRLRQDNHTRLLSSYQLSSKQHSLCDFKSEAIAEHMTLLDAELFQKIEIPEVLLWSKAQSEEHSPNLTKFTEHFNKMSFWVRTRILEQDDAKERERYLIKFIKIMKHLRKFNNFNSYLAVLSAVDSAPIRRLDWQKQNLEALHELCLLIDSSSSFRVYRHELAEAQPPCIPYIGLILQDLTFVHIGNPDTLPDGNINFAKRWQQFNILGNMRRFKKCKYEFKRNPKIMAFYNNFDDYLCEEALWQISEDIKPRGSRKKTHDHS